MRTREEKAAKQRAYRADPVVRARRKEEYRRHVSHAHVRERRRQYAKKYGADPANRERIKINNRNSKARLSHEERRRRYLKKIAQPFGGLRVIENLLAVQENRCAVCAIAFGVNNAPCVDHDHATNTLRGLLCRPCNIVEGLLAKWVKLAPNDFGKRLGEYLKNPPAKIAELL